MSVPLSNRMHFCKIHGLWSESTEERLQSTTAPPISTRSLTDIVCRMCDRYGFEKPNDRRALDVMNAAAKAVMTDLPEISIGYGVSDEYR